MKSHNAPSKSKAWVAGWDASITRAANDYKRRDFRKAFERGREAGLRSNDLDVAALQNHLLKLRGR